MSDRKLPDGWSWVTLGDLGNYYNGRGFKKSEWRDAGRPIIRIQNLTDPTKPFNYYDGDADARHTVNPGDILVSWAATLDVFRWTGGEAVLNQHIFKVESDVDPAFHFWALRSAMAALKAQTRGSGMVHITRGDFLAQEVALPPLDEQRAIVAAIAGAFSRIDAIEAELDAVHRGRERFRMSVLRDAFSGSLVRLADVAASGEQSRAGGGISDAPHELPPGWEWQKLADFCTVTMGSSPKSATFTDSPEVGTPFLQGNAEFGERNPTPKKGTTDPLRLAPAGSALVSVRAPVGAVNVTEHEVCIGRGLAALTPERDEDLAFIYWVMQAARLRLQSRATGTTFPAVTGPALKSLPIPVPPADDRDAIVAAVEDAFARIDALDALASETEKSLAELRASTLHRAFSGELLHTPASEKAHAAS